MSFLKSKSVEILRLSMNLSAIILRLFELVFLYSKLRVILFMVSSLEDKELTTNN